MPISLNGSFRGAAPPDAEFQHPPGVSVVRFVHESVHKQGFATEDFDNWRDVGWSFTCSRGSARLEFVITATGPNEWMVQVAPASIPGCLGRMFGGQPSASATDVFELSSHVHRTLADSGTYDTFRWQWDGPPTPSSDHEPVPRA